MNFASKEVHESKSRPGVTFTVRVLNEIQRARRDWKLVDARARLSSLVADLNRQPDPDGEMARTRATAADARRELTGIEAATLHRVDVALETIEVRLKRSRLNHEIELLVAMEMKPAYIRAGLIAIEGLEIDGKAATAESLIEAGDDALVEEIYQACYAASELTEDQRKNLSSPSTSSAPAGGTAS